MDEPTAPAPRLTRRTLLGSGGAVILAAGTGFGGLTLYRSRHVDVPLYSETVALEGAGRSVLVAPGRAADVVDGTRVLRSAREAADLVAQERAWLATGASWTTAGPWSSLARDALLDLRALTLPDGIPVAGWSTGWRYVWPRDAAHHEAALAVSGHADEALPALRFLSRVQDPSGWFEARYLPDGSGPPDGRTRQLDGTGWAMWATQQVAQAMPPDAARRLVTELRPMLDRSVGLIRTLVDNRAGLPAPSPDYWEVAEQELTLGTVAPLAAGLESAAWAYGLLGDVGAGRAAALAAADLRSVVEQGFGAGAYPRHLGGDQPDAAVAFLAPPYAASATEPVRTALGLAERRLERPGGGLAPGAGWKEDGISWTPETALFALAHAHTGDRAAAERILGWLAAHRTSAGSLPEKVLHDGSPAAVAPLGWTASLVLLAVAALQPPRG